MKVCVFGAGAIGGYIAAHLARVDGVEVSAVARGAHLDAIRERGIAVEKPGERFTARVLATDDPSHLGPQDYLFITLKSHQMDGALDAMRPLIGPATTILPPTTGIPFWYFHGLAGRFVGHRLERLDPGGRQWEILGPERVLGCVFWVGAEVTAPGVVHDDGPNGGFPIGEPDGSASERLMRLVRAMRAGGLAAPVRRDIRGDIWIKMINSLTWNPLATLTLADLGGIADAPELVSVARRMMQEAEAVATALGASIPVPMEKRVAQTMGARGHKMSMLQDLERGRPLEIRALADSIRAMSALANVPTPTINTVYALLELRNRTANSQ
jgi:2-dehydropantoate 2-reductase